MNDTSNHAQIDAFISYKKTRSIDEYTARLSIFKNINDGIENKCTNEVSYIKFLSCLSGSELSQTSQYDSFSFLSCLSGSEHLNLSN